MKPLTPTISIEIVAVSILSKPKKMKTRIIKKKILRGHLLSMFNCATFNKRGTKTPLSFYFNTTRL